MNKPLFNIDDAVHIASTLYGLEVEAKPLAGELDFNFHLRDRSGIDGKNGTEYVLKISHEEQGVSELDFQNQAMRCITDSMGPSACSQVVNALDGKDTVSIETKAGGQRWVRLLTFIPGRFLADKGTHSSELLENIGRFLGRVDRALESFTHPAMCRPLVWDLKRASSVRVHLPCIEAPERRALATHFLDRFEAEALPRLCHAPAGVIYNDGNDYNLLVKGDQVKGVIDFGDMLHTARICEPAIAAAYACMGKDDPVETAMRVLAGYHEVLPVGVDEVELYFYLICARLCTSVCMSAYRQTAEQDNAYLQISAKPAWELLEKLIACDPAAATKRFKQACGMADEAKQDTGLLDKDEILALRKEHIGPSLSISYEKPLKMVRGFRQYLFDENGRAYLDAVNNVPHVGYCHPRLLKAAHDQAAMLNTNTRYLHDHLVKYARRLCATMPDPLNVCFFVNSGSEANDLALRMAWTHTGGTDMVVTDGAYHGNLSSLIAISPYKFDGAGGRGAPAHVHKIATPDPYRGPFKGTDPEAGAKYAGLVEEALVRLEMSGRKCAAFICESILGCGGQVVLPSGFLKAAQKVMHQRGGIYIADEVQVGFGRVGSHFWAFETQGVVPDIVTLGKPIGGGHPLAAVITTPEIANSFKTGMEYFNTYGGNPVSCAVGMALLDVIEEEKLQENALQVGAHLLARLEELKPRHKLIGDVRGLGLFVGAELVRNHETLEPADTEAAAIIERMKDEGILLSTDGPLHNVLKMKPPLVFTKANADLLVDTLDQVMSEMDY